MTTPRQLIFLKLALAVLFLSVVLVSNVNHTRHLKEKTTTYFQQADWQAKLRVVSVYNIHRGWGALYCRVLQTNRHDVKPDFSKPYAFAIGTNEAVLFQTNPTGYQRGDILVVDTHQQAVAVYRDKQRAFIDEMRLPGAGETSKKLNAWLVAEKLDALY